MTNFFRQKPINHKMAEANAKLITDACPLREQQSYWTRWEAYTISRCLDVDLTKANMTEHRLGFSATDGSRLPLAFGQLGSDVLALASFRRLGTNTKSV
jgi:hypothetical protein